ncbi:TIGR01777 family oxidoreductase [Synoicihabitans lomoniglobus]|uniref:TIGR01777 family oxidoreductase n=1 Tax=Synoicihabitans lomoniglobus TaxID=2909285 RepID=A0AAF0I5D0_9BACT|nr:TIGR01777 family oxidoreductase [Opitutaceae bacterium LMO-M01]WED67288.1 TIGR01777 family oxidoreductase [Opitutaceae bacterium LMO-M01]
MSERFQRSVRIARSPAEVFAWHERDGAFERLTPPWEKVKVQASGGGIRDGGRVELKSKIGPMWLSWTVKHFDYREGELFCDRQISGPFAQWEHRHRFESDGAGGCVLTDDITYELPGGKIGAKAANFVAARLDRLFTYRHAVTKADLEIAPARTGRAVISGASGLIGRALVTFLRTQGWTVDRLVRRPAKAPDEISWDPVRTTVNWPSEYACDAIIHLAGAGIADGRWTQERREQIGRSRIEGTRTLVGAMRQLATLPRVFVSGSAIGIYGDRGDTLLDETSPRGEGFLADVCHEWEAEAESAATLGVRTVKLRTGLVLTPAGGALGKMLPLFQLGLGGPMGGGRHWQSWVTLDDWLRVCRHVIETDDIRGPVNVVASEPVRQRDLANVLGAVLNRPAMLSAPGGVLRLAFGQMADEALLASTRAHSAVLADTGISFLHPTLEKGLRHVLGKSSTQP